MAAKTNIKKQREEQLYAQGLTVTQIAKRFRISHQAVSKQLKLKTNQKLRGEHDTHYNLDEELRAGEDGPGKRERVRELYALGLSIDFIVEQLGEPRQAVAEMVEGDAELGRQHAARVALDRELTGGEPVTADEFCGDQARDEREEHPGVQPDDAAGCGDREVCDDNRRDSL